MNGFRGARGPAGTVSLVGLCLFFGCSAETSREPDDDNWIDRRYASDVDRYGADENLMLRRGLAADRLNRVIDVYAEATGHEGPGLGSLVDFDGGSQALFSTPVAPVDIQAALEFIGMQPGHPLDPSKVWHWPKGERVMISVSWSQDGGERFENSAPAERLIQDLAFGQTLPELGFRFVGLRAVSGGGRIAALYNSVDTVLELPYLVSETQQQGNLAPSSAAVFAAGQEILLRIRPEFPRGRLRTRDLVASIASPDGEDRDKLANMQVTLVDDNGKSLASGGFTDSYLVLERMIEDGDEPFLQLVPADDMPVSAVRSIARFARRFLIPNDVRLEMRPEHPFYSAFLPDEAWRDPANRGRASQPLEIHVGNSLFDGELVQYGRGEAGNPGSVRYRFGSRQDLLDGLSAGKPWNTNGAFVFMDPAANYGDLRTLYQLIESEFPNVYVFQ